MVDNHYSLIDVFIAELYLGKSDIFMVFRFNDRSGQYIRKLENSTDLGTGTIVSDNNRLVVKLLIYDENSTSNFRMTYSMLETGRFLSSCYSLLRSI